MNDNAIRFRLLSLLGLLLASLLVWLPVSTSGQEASDLLEVHFLDVGQGDATFIETPDGVQVLVDGGRDNSVLRQLAKEMGFFDRSIDLVVATHPDSDHIGGLIEVLKRYEVKTILLTENESDSPAATAFADIVEKERAEVLYARRGQTYDLGDGVEFEVLWPEINPSTLESNASSIILRLEHGQNSFLFTGDAPKRIEEYLVLTEGENLETDVLKVGHHGSRTSTSELFLAEVAPEYAVISASKDNSYGHPHTEVTDALFNAKVETLSTAKMGSITFLSDKEDLWLR